MCGRIEAKPSSSSSLSLPSPYRVNRPRIGLGKLKYPSVERTTEKNKSNAFTLNWAFGDENRVEVTDGCTGMVLGKKRTSRISKYELFDDFKRIESRSRKGFKSLNYYQTKLSSREYLESKKSLMKHLETQGCGSWKLIKKPQHLQFFS